MTNGASKLMTIAMGAAVLVGATGLASARPRHTSVRMKSASKAAAVTPPVADTRCGLDDLGLDQMLAKKSDAAPIARKAPSVDTIAASRDAADRFDLKRKGRDASAPRGDAELHMEAATLTPAAVGTVIAARQADLEYCFMKIPEAARGNEAFTLHLTIAPKGNVLAASVAGDENAAAIDACVQAQAKRWSFPQADAPSEIDYPLTFSIAE
ncbi:MAG: AgmX/PglI C-terminal domain-containing protein [Deltaproteobacteria bacterium]|nr:AgmX/PglI C-terminal domain-containing protein [Deltaproteobacteria bacterium]